MTELRGLAQRIGDFEKLGVKIVAISVDDPEYVHDVWDKVGGRKIIILSDPGALVIKKYGLLHANGRGDQDIALRTTLLIDRYGIEKWRRVSHSVPDIPSVDEIITQIKQAQGVD